ncbi:hypothetical protein B0H17DRAFT_1098511 [Mycena rosella]|uniref:F-box domain-containing protein n=1 Tax=Mycena rosella TaxID=1033263 RepID=A0AAD7CPA7_MYCRO|nr:hypothetical protein B0H17DRAFT_1098511 [Mycena rosella]
MRCDNCENPFVKSHLLPTPAQFEHLRDVIRSNSPPPETSSFRAIIADAPAELARYDAEIRRRQEALYALRADRALLETYADGCRSVFSPARRLPTELLGDIFDMCAPPGADEIVDDTTPKEEVDRLAKKYLLQLSRVCSRWHGVVMGTPMLWSTLVVDTVCWSTFPVSQETLLGLMAASLERGAQSPLTVEIAVAHGDLNERPVLELISRHARRWKSIYLWVNPESVRFLGAAKGNLPLLERLQLYASVENEHQSGLDIFEVAPRLTYFRLLGWHHRSPTLPWGQLLDVKFENRNSNQLSGVNMSSISLPLILPSSTSEISTLTISVRATPNELHTETPQFLAFASRSSLHSSLTSLDIQVVLQDAQLLQCLEHLTSLEELWISDYEDYQGGHALITDHLLRRLVWRPDDPTSVVPRLRFLSVASLMHFCDDSLWDFVSSRTPPGRREEGPFVVEVFWLPGRARELSSQFIGRFSALEERGALLMMATVFS